MIVQERRKGQHSAVHRLTQTHLDLAQAWRYVNELDEKCGKKDNALAYLGEAMKVIKNVIDEDLGPKLIKEE